MLFQQNIKPKANNEFNIKWNKKLLKKTWWASKTLGVQAYNGLTESNEKFVVFDYEAEDFKYFT
jgi:hypothetical protein